MAVSAYIPCYNNAGSIARSIACLQRQTVPIEQIFVVNDGSSDNSASLCRSMGITVIEQASHLGRGAARLRAMMEAKHDLVLCLDGQNQIAENFLSSALGWFENEKTAAVFARAVQPPEGSVISRWESCHLLKMDQPVTLSHQSLLMTSAALVRKKAVMQVGNYNPALVQSEDRELGERLLQAKYDVILDPSLTVIMTPSHNLTQLLVRYWRWHNDPFNRIDFRHYLKQIAYSVKVMAPTDFKQGNPLGALISLLSPHFQIWMSINQRLFR